MNTDLFEKKALYAVEPYIIYWVTEILGCPVKPDFLWRKISKPQQKGEGRLFSPYTQAFDLQVGIKIKNAPFVIVWHGVIEVSNHALKSENIQIDLSDFSTKGFTWKGQPFHTDSLPIYTNRESAFHAWTESQFWKYHEEVYGEIVQTSTMPSIKEMEKEFDSKFFCVA